MAITISDCTFGVSPKNNIPLTVYETAGGKRTLSVKPYGTAQYTYQWYSNTVNSNKGGTSLGDADGAQTASYDADISTRDTTYYYCILTTTCDDEIISSVSGVFAVMVQKHPATNSTGSGTLSGNYCFDVVETNDGGTCGTLIDRLPAKSDFADPAVNTQVYTFTPSGTVSNVRFIYIEKAGYEGKVVKSMTPNGDYSGDNSSACTMTHRL
jgi:hypothetical protein